MKKPLVLMGTMVALALAFTGCNQTSGQPSTNQSENTATVASGVQTITTKFTSRNYVPITVQKGIPVQWTIQIDAKDLNGCNQEMLIQKYGIDQKLSAGDNIIEFTPTEAGTIPYTCWMGMINSKIHVVDQIGATSETFVKASTQGQAQTVAISNADLKKSDVPPSETSAASNSSVVLATIDNNSATVAINMTASGYEPLAVIVQKGIPTNFIFHAPSQYTCALDVDFPQIGNAIDLTKNNTVTITPESDFDVQCSMGMYGFRVIVVEDILGPEVQNIIDAVQNNPSAYQFQGIGCGGGCCGS